MGGDDGEARQNWYDRLMEYLITEIEKVLDHCAQKVCFPPKKGYQVQKLKGQEAVQAWKMEISATKQRMTQVAQAGDGKESEQVTAIMKLMKIKDDLLAQVFAGLVHKKTLIWTDLKIKPGSGKNDGNNEDIYTSEKIAEAYNRIEEAGGVAPT